MARTKFLLHVKTLAAGFLFSAAFQTSASAATLTVNSAADAGGTCPGSDCTLRQALATVVSGDTINFTAGLGTITLTSGELMINKAVTIAGPGANLLTVRRDPAAANFRIFETFFVALSTNIKISGLTIANGSDTVGGAIYSSRETLSITNCVISDNTATSGGGLYTSVNNQVTITGSTFARNTAVSGGAIYNVSNGGVTLINSTLSGNSVTGGSTSAGGGLYNLGSGSVTNCTISGNSAGRSGGGIYNGGGTIAITNTTISGNTAPGAAAGGGGIYNLATATLSNTIVAKNSATTAGPDLDGAFMSQGYNLIGDPTGSSGLTNGTNNDLVGTSGAPLDPKLDTLKDNGRRTFTCALLPGSPAIDKGKSSASTTTDQRGLARPVVAQGTALPSGGDGSDIGSYEVQPDQLTGCAEINLVVDSLNDGGAGSLRSVISSACGGSTISFAGNVRGTISLTSGEFLLKKNLFINGPGALGLTIDAKNASRIFNVASGVRASISGLTLIDGDTISPGISDNSGGAIENFGTLTLDGLLMYFNSGGSGGAVANLGTLTVSNCAMIDNRSTGNGGAVRNTGTMHLTNSTFWGNGSVNSGAISSFLNSGPTPPPVPATATVTNCTVVANDATDAAATGGGLNNGVNSTMTVSNTLVANNSVPNANNGNDVSGTFTSGGHNLIRLGTAGNFVDGSNGDRVGSAYNFNLDAGPQENGGQIRTLALLAGCSAIDAGNDAKAPSTDQRGYPRVGVSDIGAFEYGSIPGSVVNVSTRLPVGTGDNALFVGFTVLGPQGSLKKVIVRAIGPSLKQLGVTDALANPTMEIHDSNTAVVATNNDWRNTQTGGLITGDQAAEISSSGVAPSDDLESAIIANLAPGAYTAVVRGVGDTTGTGLVDAYDLSGPSPARLANVATRGLVQGGDGLMIAGFIVQNAPVRAVVRAIGPSLQQFGINNALADTTLELRNQDGTFVINNDDWKSDQPQELESTGLQPGNGLEAALVATLQPGTYTAQLRGKNDTSGIGVVEIYFLQ